MTGGPFEPWPEEDPDLAAMLDQFRLGRFSELPLTALDELYGVLVDLERMEMVTAGEGRRFEDLLVTEELVRLKPDTAENLNVQMVFDILDPDDPQEPDSS